MTLNSRENSRATGEPVELYLLKGAEPSVEGALRSVVLGPGTGEYSLGTTRVTAATGGWPLNEYAGQDRSDFVVALDQLQATVPELERVCLKVAWHGNDLRVGACEIKPMVETATRNSSPYQWRSGPVGRSTTPVLSLNAGVPAYGGAPGDRSIYEAIREIRARGLKVMLHPVILMDIPAGNTKPNPYGGTGQTAYPRRRDITCNPAPGLVGTPDKTVDVMPQIVNFFGSVAASAFGWNAAGRYVEYSGSAGEWSFRRFILHMARIAAAAGGVDDFLLCSDLYGITTLRNAAGFPVIDRLKTLAADVRSMLGAGARLSYGAGWVEYHNYRPADGSGDVLFHLDGLWSDSNVDFVGIVNYLPVSDWRDGALHLDRQRGWTSIYDSDYLRSNIEGGENFAWSYASTAARNTQNRTPITDAAYSEPWVFRDADIRSWWMLPHYNRPGGVRAASPTAWVPGSKPLVFVEFGCPAVDKGTNLPGAVYDPPSSTLRPHYSLSTPDDSIQRAYYEAMLGYWPTQAPAGMLDGASAMFASFWDVRPDPTFPLLEDAWRDTAYWSTSHALSGRLRLGEAQPVGSFGTYAFTNAEVSITRDGVLYRPVPIHRSAISSSGSLDNQTLTIDIADGFDTSFDREFVSMNPECVTSLTIRQGHLGEDPDDPQNFVVVWAGRVLGATKADRATQLSAEPISTSMRRVGLRQNYQRGCPHVLYGPDCRANRPAATRTMVVASISATGVIRLTASLATDSLVSAKYTGGLVSWRDEAGGLVIRTIYRVPENDSLQARGVLTSLAAGDAVSVTLGCNHTPDDCRLVHRNILNYGGQPYIPLENPLGPRNEFF